MSASASKSKKTRWHSCNVVNWTAAGRQLWQFGAGAGSAAPLLERALADTEPLPARAITKDWRDLFQSRLNIAWLPANQVFLRVAQFPVCGLAELRPMVELQLEKLSPLPVTQIVWSVEPLPQPVGELQTVIVLIVARQVVEQFLGNLEGQGYLADRLEIPWLHQLTTARVDRDSVWIYASAMPDKTLCLVGWWIGGELRNLNLLSLPNTPDRVSLLETQLVQTAWASEMEGWLPAQPDLHLVADPQTAAEWEPHLREWAGRPIDVRPGPTPRELAALNAQRATRGESEANLLPPEFAARYRQQFIDGLWMRGLLGVGAIYLVGVMIYFAALQVVNFQLDGVKDGITAIAANYTNALQLKTRIEVVQEQLDLKFAALDCYRIAVENLPEDLSLTTLAFQKGQKVVLFGTAPSDAGSKVTDYIEALGKVSLQGTNGPPLFSKVEPPRIQAPPGNQPIKWDFACTINRKEAP